MRLKDITVNICRCLKEVCTYDVCCESRVPLLDEIARHQQQTIALNFSCVISLLCLSFAWSQKSNLLSCVARKMAVICFQKFNFTTLKKCRRKLDYSIYEMLYKNRLKNKINGEKFDDSTTLKLYKWTSSEMSLYNYLDRLLYIKKVCAEICSMKVVSVVRYWVLV